jgi:hypothetical protein
MASPNVVRYFQNSRTRTSTCSSGYSQGNTVGCSGNGKRVREDLLQLPLGGESRSLVIDRLRDDTSDNRLIRESHRDYAESTGETRPGRRHCSQSVGNDDGDGNCRVVFLEMVPGNEVRSRFASLPTSHIRMRVLSLKTEEVTNIITCID